MSEENETTELVTLEELEKQLAVAAGDEASLEKTSSQTLSIKGKRFTLGDDKLGTEIDVVVVATAHENSYYDRPWDPDTNYPPACFAMALGDGTLIPDPTSPDKQCDACKDCWANQWESAKVGKGKACKNGRRLVLLAYGEDGLSTDETVTVRLPPKSLKHWSSYAKTVSTRMKKPTYAVVTKLGFDDNEDFPVVKPTFNKAIDNPAELQSIMNRIEEFQEIALVPYNVEGYEPPEDEKETAKKDKKSKMS